MPKEVWKSILDGWYEVSSLGRVRRAKPGKATYIGKLAGYHLDDEGRLYVKLTVKGSTKGYWIHTLVANAFLGPCPKSKEINHKNLVQTDNRADNLEYLTHQENCQHAWDNVFRSKANVKLAQKKRLRTLREKKVFL